jgi:hypothetical protein
MPLLRKKIYFHQTNRNLGMCVVLYVFLRFGFFAEEKIRLCRFVLGLWCGVVVGGVVEVHNNIVMRSFAFKAYVNTVQYQLGIRFTLEKFSLVLNPGSGSYL